MKDVETDSLVMVTLGITPDESILIFEITKEIVKKASNLYLQILNAKNVVKNW